MRKAALAAIAALALLSVPAAAHASGAVEIRRVDADRLPLVRVTAVVPKGSRPALAEDGRPAAFVSARPLGSAQAVILAVDNSSSMTGRPLRDAKRAAAGFLGREHAVGRVGLVAFGHEALALTRPGDETSSVEQTLSSLAPDAQEGTALNDAVVLAVAALKQMSSGSRVLVLVTDGHDVGSAKTEAEAIASAQRANVVVYPIAAGRRTDNETLDALASATGGRVFQAGDSAGLDSAYRSLGSELRRTWQLSYLSQARPGDRTTLAVRAAGATAQSPLHVPGEADSALIPIAVAGNAVTAAFVVVLAALLFAGAFAAARGRRRRRSSDLTRLLEPHIALRDASEQDRKPQARFDALLDWTERSVSDLPVAHRLTRALERSGLELRLGHVPYLAGLAGLVLGLVGSIAGAPPPLALLLMLAGLATPFVVVHIVAVRRTRAFDRQLPDVLATIASTLRAGHGLKPALRAIADDAAPPAAEEFGRVLGEERLGRPLDEALAAMCERIGSDDMEYVATAVKVQSQTGGSLAGLFDTLAETVRERQRHARKLKALTGLGRMSAIALVAMPIGLGALMSLLSPDYMAPLYTTSGGRILIAGCLGSMAIGSVFLKYIVSVRY
jgi:tight adherence protein B